MRVLNEPPVVPMSDGAAIELCNDPHTLVVMVWSTPEPKWVTLSDLIASIRVELAASARSLSALWTDDFFHRWTVSIRGTDSPEGVVARPKRGVLLCDGGYAATVVMPLTMFSSRANPAGRPGIAGTLEEPMARATDLQAYFAHRFLRGFFRSEALPAGPLRMQFGDFSQFHYASAVGECDREAVSLDNMIEGMVERGSKEARTVWGPAMARARAADLKRAGKACKQRGESYAEDRQFAHLAHMTQLLLRLRETAESAASAQREIRTAIARAPLTAPLQQIKVDALAYPGGELSLWEMLEVADEFDIDSTAVLGDKVFYRSVVEAARVVGRFERTGVVLGESVGDVIAHYGLRAIFRDPASLIDAGYPEPVTFLANRITGALAAAVREAPATLPPYLAIPNAARA